MFSDIGAVLMVVIGVFEAIFSMVVKVVPNTILCLILGFIAGGITGALVYRNNATKANAELISLKTKINSIITTAKDAGIVASDVKKI